MEFLRLIVHATISMCSNWSDESDESDECVNLRKRHSFKIADQFSIVILAVLSFGRSSFWLPSLWQGRQIWHAVVTNGGR